ncbi:MAG TPA: serine protease [Vicinamibacterales bacterium]|jgi:S1-C subfamily serine protease|nr:serine protease [Vicinamibacterales bacterium]
MSRGFVPTLFFVLSAVLFFGLGSLFASRQSAATEEDQIASLRAEVGLLKRQQTAEAAVATAGHLTDRQPAAPIDDQSRAALVNDIKKQLRSEMGLLPVSLLRERRQSFVELYSYDTSGASNYGTAGYLGHGYFITVKHGVVALGDPTGARKITSVKLMYNGHAIPATIVDTGDADVEVDPGDWAILKVKESIDLPPLDVDLSFGFDFADPIFRLGNDYSRGIIVSTGYVGQRTSNNLVTCLTDGHPGVSGGGVLNGDGQLVGIPIGRMQGDFRFSFILPLRPEMFRKIPRIAAAATVMP